MNAGNKGSFISTDAPCRNVPKQHFAQAHVTRRRQVTLPKKVIDALGGLEGGEYLLFFRDDGRIYIDLGELRAKRTSAAPKQ